MKTGHTLTAVLIGTLLLAPSVIADDAAFGFARTEREEGIQEWPIFAKVRAAKGESPSGQARGFSNNVEGSGSCTSGVNDEGILFQADQSTAKSYSALQAIFHSSIPL